MKKIVLGLVAALPVALGVGWLWGASGRWDMDRRIRAAEFRSDMFEARSSLLSARVDLYNINFGEASRHLEDAKGLLRHATEGLKTAGRADDAKRLDPAFTGISEAQEQAGRLDQGANARAAAAVKTIDDMLGIASKP